MRLFGIVIPRKVIAWCAVILIIVVVSVIFGGEPASKQYVIRESEPTPTANIEAREADTVKPQPTSEVMTSVPSSEAVQSAATSKNVEQSPQTSQIAESSEISEAEEAQYVYSVNSKKLHTLGCSSAKRILEENRRYADAKQVSELLAQGYEYCKKCHKE